MLEKLIELTNLYIDRMPKKEKNIGIFHKYGNCKVYVKLV